MSEDEKRFMGRQGSYGIILDEYEGKYSLNEAKNNNGVIYRDWCYLSKWSKSEGGWIPDEKKRPKGIYLGDKDTAMKLLGRAYNMLKNG